MKALILSCNTGEGHNSCAKAIKEYYDLAEDECIVFDALSFVSDRASKIISKGHIWIYRYAPQIFRTGYRLAEKHPSIFQEGAKVYKFLTKGTELMYKYISEGEFDAVICTHVFSSLMLTDMLSKHPMQIKSCFVATDYTCSPSCKESNLDTYFIPDLSLKDDFLCENITSDKMIDSGIPVRQVFYRKTHKAIAKKYQGIPENHKHILIMCGSMGCGPIEKLTKSLSSKLRGDWTMTVVCGTNERLRNKLSNRYKSNRSIHIKGFVRDMSVLMDSADLYITKPGGISISEAAVKNLPMVFINAVAGCEAYNSKHFTDIGGAISATNVKELTDICVELLNDESKLIKMHENLAERNRYNAAKVIISEMENIKAV